MKKLETFVVPEWTIVYLEYGDNGEYTEKELLLMEEFVQRNNLEGCLLDWEDSPIFTCGQNDVTGVSLCECLHLNVIRPE